MCVDPYPESRTRPEVMAGLQSIYGRLGGLAITGEMWVDGSFLTAKMDPETLISWSMPRPFSSTAAASDSKTTLTGYLMRRIRLGRSLAVIQRLSHNTPKLITCILFTALRGRIMLTNSATV